MSKVYEIWRVQYKKNAYADQTGLTHWGRVVWEQILVTETGRFDQMENYTNTNYPNVGIYCVAEDGRTFERRVELVDYSGGHHWKETTDLPPRMVRPDDYGYWRGASKYVKGYVYPDGSGPVESIMP